MIRDPSDGSVREQTTSTRDKNPIDRKSLLSADSSGLPLESQRVADQEKLERSREWLRKYRTDPESVTRLLGEQGE